MSEVSDPLQYLDPTPLRAGHSCPYFGCPWVLREVADGLKCDRFGEVFAAA